ncbi:hypothetical protein [Acetobacterium bakii]|uniref:Uncharacterized protein n=1 Tax=Acetobacterium bakii TaxID=52689 RepID=A0A0L6U064_9FIRM|nr:hypothetical protein [Acetobacterium bakii]KNZ41889.1 hypothetical protein AKG39_09755 [Acetobacterium bakii]
MSNESITLSEHDENCGCGCHDEQHPSEAHHHHEHKPITVTTHDTSIVGSYKFTIEKPYEEAEIVLDELLRHVAKDVTALGGIIGHIKAFLTSKGKSCMISITEDDSDKHHIESSHCVIEGVAIVFCIVPEQLESILKETFSAYIID